MEVTSFAAGRECAGIRSFSDAGGGAYAPLGGQQRQFSKIAVFVDLPHHPGGVAEPEHRAAGVPLNAGRELAEAGDLVARHHRADRLAEPERVAFFHIADVPMEPGVIDGTIAGVLNDQVEADEGWFVVFLVLEGDTSRRL